MSHFLQPFSNSAYIKYRATRQVSNDAESFDIQVQTFENSIWKVIGVHHLSPAENKSMHHLYVDILDKHGRKYATDVWLRFQAEGQEPFIQKASSVNRPAGTFPLMGFTAIAISIAGTSLNSVDASEQVMNIHTGHPDDGNDSGNSFAHHSFFVVFMATSLHLPIFFHTREQFQQQSSAR